MADPQMSNDLDVSENQVHSCQCSAMSGGVEFTRVPRERSDRGIGSMRISSSQDLPRGLEGLQNAFEPIRRLDSPSIQQDCQQISLDTGRSIDMLEHQGSLSLSPRSSDSQSSMLPKHSHNISCNPRGMDISRSLAFEAARRVQESASHKDNQHIVRSSPSPLLESSNALLEKTPVDLEHQMDDRPNLSQKQSCREKIKNKPTLNPYQHHHEPTSASEKNVHAHYHLDSHVYTHKHMDDYRSSSNLDNRDGIMSYQHQRQHTHHHHANLVSGGGHHHGSSSVHQSHGSQINSLNHYNAIPTNSSGRCSPSNHHHHLGSGINLSHHQASGFVEHHGGSSALSGASSNSSMMNHGGSPAVHRHGTNSNSLSTTPLVGHHHHGSSSGSVTGHSSVNHHHGSSGISCESSSSNARTHSRLDHVHDHHHHLLQTVHPLHSNHSDNRRAPSSMEHHAHHHGHIHTLGHSHPQTNETKITNSLMGVDAIQVSSPSKSKCQCHVVQQNAGSKRGPEGDSSGVGEVTSRTHQPPALPPRPPPRPTRSYETTAANQCHTGDGGCCKKYVVLCCLCGGLSASVGSLFLAVHAVLSAHTASLALFETVPSYIPGIMLILMGLFTMLLARRKHRYGILMKVCGSVGVVCALVCVLVTVTTTVIHMSRLQGLRECVYTKIARSCTCYGAPPGKGDPGVLFEGTPHCEAVHGALYACLRALFGVSVAGILACIFSCMLVYQLLSHEKKKMYWEQLELRCRSLYGQGAAVGATTASCGCCNDCGGASPWWAQTPGNLYTPNPDLAPSRRWRLPWSRSRGPAPSPDSNYGFHTQARQAETVADSGAGPYSVLNSQTTGPYSVLNTQNNPYTPSNVSYSVLEAPVPLWGPPPPYSDPNSPARRPQPVEPRPRIAKRMENYESNEEHRPRPTKRPSDNYENAEEISNSTDPEGGNDGTIKSRRARKPLKGVENGAFQQEANSASKQSESELYFGDVSSCCGPESSFYDLAVDKEGGDHAEGVEYLTNRVSKRQLSKRSRLPLPLPKEGVASVPSDSYANGEEPRSARGPFLAPDAQYEVIQQRQYAYYTPKESAEELQEGPTTSNYFREEEQPERPRDYRDRSIQEEETPQMQCCLSDSTTLDSGWQSGEQQQSDDSTRPVNV
ncbi:uncharacterized protein [Prorops nasuta]|uniref:uncharacterized protein n=1 Tax=Prorops nasuta TaxID=863751 RepID=UPI0034CFD5EB